ncbi:MAG: cupin domain-containing protein [Caldithrix sp.]|nr:MAG: cupin domain-containing protein [Caldithrix sp.]
MIGEKKTLANLVDYQAESVVSKTIIKKEPGTVTLFAFAEGEGLSEHTSPHEAMVYLLDGEAMITIAGNPFHLRQGEMIILPADKPHALKAMKKFKMLLVMIKEL